MERTLRVILAGDPWTIQRVGKMKDCYAYANFGTRTIGVEEEHEGLHLLVYLLHEALHCLFPNESEKKVSRSAEELAEMIRAAGLLREDGAESV